MIYLRNIKHFPCWYTVISTRMEIGKTRNCVEAAGRSVFTQFRVFPIFTSVDITVYQYGKNVLYFFYNIAQRTFTEEWREIFPCWHRVISGYINTALSQSAFRIYKCYIIIFFQFNLFLKSVWFYAQDEIESVLVVGGGFRIPKVQDILLNAVKKWEISYIINSSKVYWNTFLLIT